MAYINGAIYTNYFKDCYATGVVEGKANIGGFIGAMASTQSYKSEFTNCYSTAMVGMTEGGSNMGGFVGNSTYGIFKDCYAAGEVGTLSDTIASSWGGFAGTGSGSYTNCYYDKQTTAMKEYAQGGSKAVSGITGKTTEELQNSNFLGDAFDTEAGFYPQLKVFKEPASDAFGSDINRLTVKAYSAASGATALFNTIKDDNGAVTGYDTVRDIMKRPSFSSTVINPDYDIKWTAGNDQSPMEITRNSTTVHPPVLEIGRSSKEDGTEIRDDHVTKMYPGIGWANAKVTMSENGNTVIGKRAMRIVATTTMILGESDHALATGGKDSRIYVGQIERQDGSISLKDQIYNHRNTVDFVKTTAKELNDIISNNAGPLTAIRYNPDITGTGFSDVPVNNSDDQKGKITTRVYKRVLDPAQPGENTEVLVDLSKDDLEAKFRGETPFTNGSSEGKSDDRGVYRIEYEWKIPVVGSLVGATASYTDSKMLTIMNPVQIIYYNNVGDNDADAGEYQNPEGFDEKLKDTVADKAVFDIYGDVEAERDLSVGSAAPAINKIVDGEDGKPVAVSEPSRTGYRCIGWSTDPADTKDLTHAFIPGTTKITEDTKVYAVWQPRKYDLQFSHPVGSFEDKAPQTLRDISYNKSVKTDNKAFPQELEVNDVDTAANKIFLGWSTIDPANPPVDPESGKAVEAVVNFDENTVISKTQDAFKYSRYFENEGDANTVISVYPVLNTAFGTAAFYQNDGSQEEDGSAKIYETQQKNYNDAVVRPAVSPSRPGYIFRGWSDEALAPIEKNESFEEVLKAGESVTWLGENQSYYAIWERVPCTVEFYRNDGATEVQPYRSLSNKTYGDKLSAAELAGPSRTGYGFAGWSVKKDASAADFTEGTAIAGNTTLYAVWKINEYTVTFYEGEEATAEVFGQPVTGVKYNTSVALPQENPTREGYTFAGWKYKENGREKDFTDQAAIVRDTRVYAAWTKAVYDLDVFMTPDSKNPQKPDKTLADIPYGEALGNRLPGAQTFWTDKNNQKYQFTGFVDGKGNPVDAQTAYEKGDLPDDKGTLTATFTQKVYDITAEKSGYGSITGGTGTFKAGDNTAVTWAPDKGYEVGRVLVDGQVRDDLRGSGKAGSVTFDAIGQNHHVSIVFEKETEAPEPQKWYTIYTTKNGGGDASTLTQTATVEAGKDYEVKWQAADGYRVVSITVDGVDHPVSDSGTIPFTQVGSDHEVVVNFEPIAPDMDAGKTPGFWTITTRQTGGDPAQTTVTPTMVVSKNSDPVIAWGALENSGYQIKSILLDKGTADERALTAEEIAQNQYVFEKISGDHTVDVVFVNENGEIVDPEKKLYKVETILTGGPGSITGSAVVPEGGSYEVEWAGPSDERYIVEDIKVNGEPQETTKTQEVFENIQEDSRIEVKLKPNLRHIETDKVGSGSISPSKTVFYKEDYTVEAKPQEGWYLRRVEFDGEVKEFDDPSAAQAKAFGFFKERVVQADDLIQVNGDEITVPLQSIVADHQIRVTFVKNGEEEIPADALCSVKTSIVGGPGTIEGGGTFQKGESTLVTWKDIEEPFVIDSIAVTVDGVLDRDLSQAAQNGRLALPDLQNNYEVVVTLKHGDDKGSEIPPDQPGNTYDVVTRIGGAPGAGITASQLGVNEGRSVPIEWQYDNNLYEIKDVRIDGQSCPELITADGYTFEGLNDNHLIEVVLGERNATPPVPEPGQFSIMTSVAGGTGGAIDPSVIVSEGGSQTIAWKAQEGYRVAAVIVDGVVRDDLRDLGDTGQVSFEDIHENHSVTVIYKKENGAVTPEHFVVETSMEGRGTITPTQTRNAGEDHEVVFTPEMGWKATRVEIDGVVCNEYIESGRIFFKGLSENHRVSVIFEKESGAAVLPDDNSGDGSNESVIPDKKPEHPASPILPAYPGTTGYPVVTVGDVAPYTGLVGDIVQRSEASANPGAAGGYTPLLQRLLGFFSGNGDGSFDRLTDMSLIDLLSTALCLAMAVCAFCFKKKARWVTLLIATAAVLIFFVTQPLVLTFILADRFSPVFLLLVCVSAIGVLVMGEKKEEENEEIE
ncbi:InlB B-repeat-containing protein [Eubacterium callanderi]|uniref:InlB B-repeat-containing protein n=1 Tax=Eubacterium callanderi TaxID=53442 RepID=UPI00399AD4D6